VLVSFCAPQIGDSLMPMAKSSCADGPARFVTSPEGTSGDAVGSNYLRPAIMQLLPAVNDVVAAHSADDVAGGCQCAFADRCECPTLKLAAAALDLIIRCWRLTRSKQEWPGARPVSRDLRVAVESKRLADSESAALEELLGVLDLAATQAEGAGMSLPILAGIAVAVVDSYRAIVFNDIRTATR
jgi:hypothetical protein